MIELLLRIGGIVFPVFAIAAVGALWGRRHRPDMSVVNRLNVEVFAPALVFWALADKPLDFDLYRDLAIGGIAVVLGSGLLLWPFVRLAGIDARTFIPPMMFNNSGNMGIPLALFAFGETALQAAVVLFIIEMVLHFTVGLYILDHRTRPWRLLKMPMIQATIAGLACSAFGLTLPAPLANTIKLMGQVSIPLLLFALGVRLLDVNLRDWKLGTFGAVAGVPLLASDELVVPLGEFLIVALTNGHVVRVDEDLTMKVSEIVMLNVPPTKEGLSITLLRKNSMRAAPAACRGGACLPRPTNSSQASARHGSGACWLAMALSAPSGVRGASSAATCAGVLVFSLRCAATRWRRRGCGRRSSMAAAWWLPRWP